MNKYTKVWKSNGDTETLTREQALGWISANFRHPDQILKGSEELGRRTIGGEFSELIIEKL